MNIALYSRVVRGYSLGWSWPAGVMQSGPRLRSDTQANNLGRETPWAEFK